jgi:hypothetical protein
VLAGFEGMVTGSVLASIAADVSVGCGASVFGTNASSVGACVFRCDGSMAGKRTGYCFSSRNNF